MTKNAEIIKRLIISNHPQVLNQLTMGRKYRKSESSSSSYENIRNRIDLDYPELNYTLNPIIGPVGTTIVFDTDLFHMGGNVVDGQERLVIRSHFYGEGNWREL